MIHMCTTLLKHAKVQCSMFFLPLPLGKAMEMLEKVRYLYAIPSLELCININGKPTEGKWCSLGGQMCNMCAILKDFMCGVVFVSNLF